MRSITHTIPRIRLQGNIIVQKGSILSMVYKYPPSSLTVKPPDRAQIVYTPRTDPALAVILVRGLYKIVNTII